MHHTDTFATHPAGDAPMLLLVEGLSFSYPQRALFTDWSARIPPGVTLVRGGDGVGKTTLLGLLAGVLPAQSGRLQIDGISLAAQPAAYRQRVFWADPRSSAHDQTSASTWFKSLHPSHPGFNERLLPDLVEGLGLKPHLDKPLYMLSTGSKRKVWLASAFACGAAVTLLDDPFAALDKASIGFVLELLREAACHPSKAWVVAHHTAPENVQWAAQIDLGD